MLLFMSPSKNEHRTSAVTCQVFWLRDISKHRKWGVAAKFIEQIKQELLKQHSSQNAEMIFTPGHRQFSGYCWALGL